jgi:hypothetical protein
MGKRSSFERRPMDFYSTPEAAVLPLLPWLPRQTRFCEPCAGEGDLIRHLEKHGHQCITAFDADHTKTTYPVIDAMFLMPNDLAGANMIITNPPWSRQILHTLIDRFACLAPTWLLFDADWAFTKQSTPYMDYCRMIVAVGRVKWIEGSKNTGKDNCAWYLFGGRSVPVPEGCKPAPPLFVGRR